MYVYAFVYHRGLDLEFPVGIARPVRLVVGDRLAAVVEPDVAIDELQADDERLMHAVLAHDRVICDINRQTDALLPLRFGTLFPSEQTLRAHLKGRDREYGAKLDRLAGKAEYTLKFTPGDPPEESATSRLKGKDYLLAKKQRYRERQWFQREQKREWEEIRATISTLYPEAIVAEAQENTQRLHLLAPYPNETLYQIHFPAWQQACPRWQIQLDGPLPVYHFA